MEFHDVWYALIAIRRQFLVCASLSCSQQREIPLQPLLLFQAGDLTSLLRLAQTDTSKPHLAQMSLATVDRYLVHLYIIESIQNRTTIHGLGVCHALGARIATTPLFTAVLCSTYSSILAA